MFNDFEFFVMPSRTTYQPIKAPCAALVQQLSVKIQCMQCINRLRVSYWFDYIQPLYKHYSGKTRLRNKVTEHGIE